MKVDVKQKKVVDIVNADFKKKPYLIIKKMRFLIMYWY